VTFPNSPLNQAVTAFVPPISARHPGCNIDLRKIGKATNGEEEVEEKAAMSHEVWIPVDSITLPGELSVPDRAKGLVLFAHGSGSSRHSPRNQYVAQVIREAGVGTLLLDLLTREEERIDLQTPHLRFDTVLLARRLDGATKWAKKQIETSHLRVGYFGASTGGGAALVAAAELGGRIGAIVSRGGRPDMAGEALSRVISPTLLIVGGSDEAIIRLNEEALGKLQCVKELKIVLDATHLFEEPGKLEEVARLAADWFRKHLRAER
jgi:predicted alpha/beta-hydrolase family hydrolase